jgi:hypothetical protein
MNSSWLKVTNDGVWFLLAAATLYLLIVGASELYQRYLFRKSRKQRANYYLRMQKDKEFKND